MTPEAHTTYTNPTEEEEEEVGSKKNRVWMDSLDDNMQISIDSRCR